MKSAYAVIGANWGDEGKGLAVDALADRLIQKGRPVTVIRANGGAQAGHTVVCPKHRRHVFHHIGAGTLAGASTHLSQFFVAHPMLLSEELSQLRLLGASPRRVTIDPRAPVTTPWDMAINQALEMARASKKHGSTGLGFGETIERMTQGVRLVAADLYAPGLANKLNKIRNHWLPARRAQLGLVPENTPLGAVLSGTEEVLDAFQRDCDDFVSTVTLLDGCDLSDGEALIFEGAQGLQLDMNIGQMPHVTRSRTGLANVIRIAEETGIDHIQTSYMTRCYATRHGAGPLPHEPTVSETLSWLILNDSTNIPNPWQGSLRVAPLDLDGLKQVIGKDLQENKGAAVAIDAKIGITCLDQIDGTATLLAHGRGIDITAEKIAQDVSDYIDLPVMMTSWGRCRSDVIFTHNS